MKEYIARSYHRGQEIHISCCANSRSEASRILNISNHYLKNYGYVIECENQYEGVLAYYDSGFMFEKKHDMTGKKLPLEEMRSLIDSYRDIEYSEFLKQINYGN